MQRCYGALQAAAGSAPKPSGVHKGRHSTRTPRSPSPSSVHSRLENPPWNWMWSWETLTVRGKSRVTHWHEPWRQRWYRGRVMGGTEGRALLRSPPPHPPSSCPYLVRVPARLLVGVKHVLLPELLHVAVQHRAYPAGGGGGSGTVPGSAATTPVPTPPRGPGLTAWRCQRRPTAPPASLRATDLDGNRDIAGARQHPEPPREAPEQR